MTKEFDIVPDPRKSASQEDLKSQFDFLIKVRDQLSAANQGVIDIRAIKPQMMISQKRWIQNTKT